ncbi:MBL fold metallo-hydrolase [Archaeoglobus neptunius]|uniref:MBL fold metallo-hydrolase n=1 Tax=Archaeoglobus neptunius TaxID=2798580 RepID=UPI001929652C|nr:MBL fold metallo-hydrolase [Archaeoglobus neptunius]
MAESSFVFSGVEVTWLKHAGFKIKGSVVVYIDPYEIPEGLEKADVILVTHDHFDHLDIRSIRRISKDDTVVVHPAGCIIEGFRSCGVNMQETTEVKGVKIRAVPAYNIDKPFHKGNSVGYIINIDGVSIYHAGDTDRIPEMKEIEVDIALLPVGGTYTMNLEEAIEATRDIGAKHYIPMHYGAIPQTEADPEEFRKRVKGAVVLKPLF